MNALFTLTGKTALVTGGSRGIGRMIASGYAEAGVKVYIASRDMKACASTADELSKVGECIALSADLSTESGCRALAEAVRGCEDRLDILVNNAGNTWAAPIQAFDNTAWDRVLGLNVKGLLHTTNFLLPLLETSARVDDPSRIINVGSINAIDVPDLETYSYTASKAAVHQLTRHLAKRLAPNITVNAIAPGPFESKMMAATLASSREQIAASAPMRRIGRPAERADGCQCCSARHLCADSGYLLGRGATSYHLRFTSICGRDTRSCTRRTTREGPPAIRYERRRSSFRTNPGVSS